MFFLSFSVALVQSTLLFVTKDQKIPFHEPLALRVDQVTTLTTATLSHQTASAIDTSGVKLYKFHVLIR